MFYFNFFLWCLICGWLQLCIMYIELVKSSWQFRPKSWNHSLLLMKTTFIAVSVLVALNSGTLDPITNILHAICTLSKVFHTYDEASAHYFIVHNQHFCIPISIGRQSGGCSIFRSNQILVLRYLNCVNSAWALSGNCKMFIRSWLLKIHFGKF